MQEKNNRNSNSLGIFRKLLNLSDKLLGRGVKRLTVTQHVSLSPARPSGEMMVVNFQDEENSEDDLVPFKRFEGPVDEFSSQPQMHKAADRITDQVRSSRDKAMEKGKKVSEQPPGRKKEFPLVQEKIDPPQLQGKSFYSLPAAVRSRVPKKMVSVKESEEEDRSKNKGKNTPSNQNLTFTTQDEEVKRTPRITSPLPGLAPNIDKKSEAFIKRTKEAMTRNLSMDTKPS